MSARTKVRSNVTSSVSDLTRADGRTRVDAMGRAAVSPRLRGLVAAVEAARSVSAYLGYDNKDALSDVSTAIERAAVNGAGLSPAEVRALLEDLKAYEAEYAAHAERCDRFDTAVLELVTVLNHPCPAC